MTRDEHLAWCKERALEYVDRRELGDAVASMSSDMMKHPETKDSALVLMELAILHITQGDVEGVRRWIEGFR